MCEETGDIVYDGYTLVIVVKDLQLKMEKMTIISADNNSLKNTVNSTYDLVKEDIIHETSLSPTNIQDDDNNYDLVEEDFIHETSLSASNIQDSDNNSLKKTIQHMI